MHIKIQNELYHEFRAKIFPRLKCRICALKYQLAEVVLTRASPSGGGQLILQTALSFMPTVVVSAAVGLVVCGFIINPLMAVFLGGLGIVKCTFTVPVGFITAAGPAPKNTSVFIRKHLTTPFPSNRRKRYGEAAFILD